MIGMIATQDHTDLTRNNMHAHLAAKQVEVTKATTLLAEIKEKIMDTNQEKTTAEETTEITEMIETEETITAQGQDKNKGKPEMIRK